MKFTDANNNELDSEFISKGPPEWKELFGTLLHQIQINKDQSSSQLLFHKASMIATKNGILRLQQFNAGYSFKGQPEEIYFFKQVKPYFFSFLIFHDICYEIELRISAISEERIQRYLQRQLHLIDIFFEEYKFFYEYLLLGEKYLDDRFFVRVGKTEGMPDTYLLSEGMSPIGGYDYIFARLIANKWIGQYITPKVVGGKKDPFDKFTRPKAFGLQWTDSRTSLIELCYALQASGSINQGKATVKQIVELFQEMLNIQLGNFSHTRQEILRRKSGYTTYIDSLKKSYLLGIERNETKQF